jgi:peptidoglycan/xylan/chitin deacetylase (PgdA/CDA1 family)
MSTGLERLLLPRAAADIEMRRGNGPAEWLYCGDWRVFASAGESTQEPDGAVIARFRTDGGRELTLAHRADGQGLCVPFDLDDAYANYISEAWRGEAAPRQLSAQQLNVFYRVKHFIPRRAQLAGRRALVRWQGLPEFPRWPFDPSVVKLLHLYARCLLEAEGREEVPFRWFWPRGLDAAAILTHDVESADGLRLALELADLEQERGLRSSFNVVADWYPIDRGALRELIDRGFEIGVHGVHHDRSMFASRESFEAQQPAVREAAREFEAEGFRSPATHRVFDWLGDLPVAYDCTMPHSDPFEPQPGGCCSLWPFRIGSVVELPYTMPQDHTLLTLLRHDSATLWIEQLDTVARNNGLAQMLTHPDAGYLGEPGKRRVYADFLDALVERPRLWKPLPREVARWWNARERDGGGEEAADGTVRRGDGPFGVVLDPPATP